MASGEMEPLMRVLTRSAEMRSMVCAHVANQRTGSAVVLRDGRKARITSCGVTEMAMEPREHDGTEPAVAIRGRFEEELQGEDSHFHREGSFEGTLRVKGVPEGVHDLDPGDLCLQGGVLWKPEAGGSVLTVAQAPPR